MTYRYPYGRLVSQDVASEMALDEKVAVLASLAGLRLVDDPDGPGYSIQDGQEVLLAETDLAALATESLTLLLQQHSAELLDAGCRVALQPPPKPPERLDAAGARAAVKPWPRPRHSNPDYPDGRDGCFLE